MSFLKHNWRSERNAVKYRGTELHGSLRLTERVSARRGPRGGDADAPRDFLAGGS